MRTFSHYETREVTGIPASTLRRMECQGPIRPEGGRGAWTWSQVLGLAAMRHSRLAGATTQTAIGLYHILRHAEPSSLRAASAEGKNYLRAIGELVDGRLVSHRAAFDRRLLISATKQLKPFVIVDVRHWIERIDEMEKEFTAKRMEQLAV